MEIETLKRHGKVPSVIFFYRECIAVSSELKLVQFKAVSFFCNTSLSWGVPLCREKWFFCSVTHLKRMPVVVTVNLGKNSPCCPHLCWGEGRFLSSLTFSWAVFHGLSSSTAVAFSAVLEVIWHCQGRTGNCSKGVNGFALTQVTGNNVILIVKQW